MGKLPQLISDWRGSPSFRARPQAAARNPGGIRLDSHFRGNDENRSIFTSCPRSWSLAPTEDQASSVGVWGWQVHPPGFTLLEVAIVLTLLSILIAILALQFRPLLAQTHLSDATRQMVANLQYVRMKAIAQNCRLRVTFRPTNRDYIIDKDEDGTWQRQLLHSHTEIEVPGATIALPRDVQIAAVNSGGDVIFLPRGAVDGGIAITLGTMSGSNIKRVVVNLAGRVRVE